MTSESDMRSAEPFAAEDFAAELFPTDAGFEADRAAGVFTAFLTGLFMDILVELLVGMGLSFNRLGL